MAMKHYPAEFKADAIALYRSRPGATYAEIADEAAPLNRGAAVRDSQHPQRGHLAFPPDEWAAFLAAARRGEM